MLGFLGFVFFFADDISGVIRPNIAAGFTYLHISRARTLWKTCQPESALHGGGKKSCIRLLGTCLMLPIIFMQIVTENVISSALSETESLFSVEVLTFGFSLHLSLISCNRDVTDIA